MQLPSQPFLPLKFDDFSICRKNLPQFFKLKTRELFLKSKKFDSKNIIDNKKEEEKSKYVIFSSYCSPFWDTFVKTLAKRIHKYIFGHMDGFIFKNEKHSNLWRHSSGKTVTTNIEKENNIFYGKQSPKMLITNPWSSRSE